MHRFTWVALLVASLVLTNCVRSASTPGIGTATIFPAITPITPTIVQADFPLELGSTWIYDYSTFYEEEKATYSVTDTIVAVEIRDGFLIVEVEQEVKFEEGDAFGLFLNEPTSGRFWYLFDGVHLYKQTGEPDPASVADAWLELVFPLGGSGCWFPDAHQRAELQGVANAAGPVAGCRSASGDPYTIEVPAGKFEACLDVVTPYNSGSTLLTFCPGVGIVATHYDHSGSQFGYHSAMTGYLLPTSNGGTP
jgi:hypothetical protein